MRLFACFAQVISQVIHEVTRALHKLFTCFTQVIHVLFASYWLALVCYVNSLLNVFVPRAETATACLQQRTLLDYSEEERVVPNINFWEISGSKHHHLVSSFAWMSGKVDVLLVNETIYRWSCSAEFWLTERIHTVLSDCCSWFLVVSWKLLKSSIL